MKHNYFHTTFLNGIACSWMRRRDPRHPCHRPHIGEVYCLYGEEVDWGNAIFNAISLPGVTIVHSRYHILCEIIAKTTIDQPLFELGFILRNGGSIKYDDEKTFDLSSLQMNLDYHPFLDCTVTMQRSYTETLDFHFDVSFMQPFVSGFSDILQPYLDAIENQFAYNRLDYSPFVNASAIRQRLLKIRRIITQKSAISKNERYHLLRLISELFEATCREIRDLAYPRLLEPAKSRFNQFETNPLAILDSLPRVKEVSQSLGVSQMTLCRLIKERHHMTVRHFITQKWVEAAAEQLCENFELTIESIAFGLGWGSPAQFSNAFKLIKEISPSEYRSKYGPKPKSNPNSKPKS